MAVDKILMEEKDSKTHPNEGFKFKKLMKMYFNGKLISVD